MRRSSISSLLGTVLGGVLGGVFGPYLLLHAMTSQRSFDDTPGAGIGLVLALAYGVIGGIFIGAFFGGFLVALPRILLAIAAFASSSNRPSAKSLGITAAIIVVCAPILWLIFLNAGWKAQERESAVEHSRAMATHLRPTQAPAAQSAPQNGISYNPTGAPSPFATTVAAVYGDLVYPNGQIISPNAQMVPANGLHPEIPCAFAAVQSGDRYEQTVSYYRSRVSPVSETSTAFTGVTQRVSDGRRTFVHIEKKGDSVIVELNAS